MLRSTLLRALLERLAPPSKFLASAAAVVGIAGGLSSMLGSKGGDTPNPNSYIYTNPAQQATASTDWMSLMGMLYGTPGTPGTPAGPWGRAATPGTPATPGSVQNFANMVNPSIMGGLKNALATDTSGLSTLGPMLQQSYGNIANADSIWASLLGQNGQNSMNALYQGGIGTYLNALDPQQALHDRMQHDVIESSRAGQSARGIAMGGVGQGMEDQAVGNFNIDWQNQLLGRQVQGLTAMEQSMAGGAQIGQNNAMAGIGLLGQIPGAQTSQVSAPMAAPGLDMSFLNSLMSGYGGMFQNTQVAPFLQGQNQIIPFLSGGQGAGANAMNGAFTGYGINQQNSANGMEALLTGLNGAGKAPVGSWINSMWNKPSGGGTVADGNYSMQG